MKKLTASQIRQLWLDFFKEKGHYIVPSAPLIPQDDPTLLWINSGVASLKKYFDGSKKPPHPRLTNAQKCIRTNDIENVGVTARHHTFFEMLGNFSIGDYFKKEAITWGFELMTSPKWFGFELEKLYFTYYPDDLETKEIWLSLGVSENRLVALESNFWEIGEGPCGPNTEIIYDRGEKYDARGEEVLFKDLENDRYVELWNIVFSSFNAKEGLDRKDYPKLPRQNIDTGAGFERFCSVIQGVDTNYEIDLFKPILNHIEKLSGQKFNNQKAFKVIADHIKTLTFAINDGAVISNEGRGYVLRRLIRRAIKQARSIGILKPFMYLLVDDVILSMSDYYTELLEKPEIVKTIIKKEEEKFLKTIEQGERLFYKKIKDVNKLDGKTIFELYDTYGFPVELTKEYADENNIELDLEGFKIYLEEQRNRSRQNRSQIASMKSQRKDFLEYKEKSEFTGYTTLHQESKVIKVFEDGGFILDKTPFYAEGGGQVPDKGLINGLEVLDVIKLPNGQHMHIVDEKFNEGDMVNCQVFEYTRTPTMYNHSATHLIHQALKDVLGNYSNQHGSKVAPDYLRFDFNAYNFPTDQELLKAEKIVKEKIKEQLVVKIEYMPYQKAIEKGAIALFGEKYEEEVRMVNMQEYSKELCGGTHVKNTIQIKDFSIVSIESIGSGMYRLFAVSGTDLKDKVLVYLKPYIEEVNKIIEKISNLYQNDMSFEFEKMPDVICSYQDVLNYKQYLSNVLEKSKKLEKQYEDNLMNNEYKKLEINTNKNEIIHTNINTKVVKEVFSQYFEKNNKEELIFINCFEEKIMVLVRSNSKNAQNYLKLINQSLGSKGGGKPDFATGGGGDSKLILNTIKEFKF